MIVLPDCLNPLRIENAGRKHVADQRGRAISTALKRHRVLCVCACGVCVCVRAGTTLGAKALGVASSWGTILLGMTGMNVVGI